MQKHNIDVVLVEHRTNFGELCLTAISTNGRDTVLLCTKDKTPKNMTLDKVRLFDANEMDTSKISFKNSNNQDCSISIGLYGSFLQLVCNR